MQKIILGVIGVVIIVGIIAYVNTNVTEMVDYPAQDATPMNTAQKQTGTQVKVGETQLTGTTTDENLAGMIKKNKETAVKRDIVAVTAHAENYKFIPNTLKAKVGQTVRVTVTNDSGFHDFVIDEFQGAKTKRLQSGQSETIEFIAEKKGAFTYYCSVGQHRAMGMEGTLTVE